MPDAENRAGQGRQGIGREIRRRQGHRQAAVLHTYLDGDGRGLVVFHAEQLRRQQAEAHAQQVV